MDDSLLAPANKNRGKRGLCARGGRGQLAVQLRDKRVTPVQTALPVGMPVKTRALPGATKNLEPRAAAGDENNRA
eukprot:11162664-Lingulodinium_polyedra.AAC.1